MNEILQLALAFLATIAAIASAVAAWKSYVASQGALAYQKKYTKHQADVFALRLAHTNLSRLKRILRNPLAASDEDFSSVDLIYLEIKNDLERLSENNILPTGRSAFLAASSLAELLYDKGAAVSKIDIEIKMIEATINDLIE